VVETSFPTGARFCAANLPLLSVEITSDCPLSCPGCYAYSDRHLGGGLTLTQLSDARGNAVIEGILKLVEQHNPMQLSLVGGEPLMRHRELDQLLPILSARGVHTMLVTSGVIPIPYEWTSLPRVTVAVSVDGLPEHHDQRRKPATYERILRNIAGRRVYIHWTAVRSHVQDLDYAEGYLEFWSAREEVHRIWMSVYTPQRGEQSAERLTAEDRQRLAEAIPWLAAKYPKFLGNPGIARAILRPPASPADCAFARVSANYTADLRTRVQPCVFGGDPDCSECGCAISSALHWIINETAGARRVLDGSLTIGAAVARLKKAS
jgi:MoaA/NifB/PqqE/SkfB family radical SAM enzyme